MLAPLAAFEMPGFASMLLIGAIGLLIFGKRLPEVGKSLGRGIVEFKKGLKGIEDEVDAQVNAPAMARGQYAPPTYPQQQNYGPPQFPPPAQQVPQYAPVENQPVAQQAPQPTQGQPQFKFDPYTGKPIEPQA